jgi:hypothetical protein
MVALGHIDSTISSDDYQKVYQANIEWWKKMKSGENKVVKNEGGYEWRYQVTRWKYQNLLKAGQSKADWIR